MSSPTRIGSLSGGYLPHVFGSALLMGCAVTALDTPSNSAANPRAHTMPIAAQASPLKEDFDPWAESDGAGADTGQAGHSEHEAHEGQAGRAPASATAPHEGHEVSEPAAPKSEGHDHE